jgi:hypothetical protein
MSRSLFISLPVADVERARTFFGALGLPFDPKFSDARAACVQINDQLRVMLLARPVFESFAHKPVPDPMTTTQHLLALVLDSREAVDDVCQRAVAAGAVIADEDDEEHAGMYQRAFHDLDGHPWAITWFAPSAPAGEPA